MSAVFSADVEARETFTDTEYVRPVGALEEAVARIIAAVLNVDRVSRTDGFYDFGGTSLHAVRICARVAEELGVTARPEHLFDSDTLEEFVASLETPVRDSRL